MKIVVFRCLVNEAAVAGWTAVAHTRADTAMLDSIVFCFARKLVGSRALKKNELSQPATQVSEVGSALPVEHVAHLSDASVWRLVRSVPVNIELQIRRLK